MLRDPFDLWSSSRELERLRREMNRLFDRPAGSMPSAAAGYPAMNVWANNEASLSLQNYQALIRRSLIYRCVKMC